MDELIKDPVRGSAQIFMSDKLSMGTVLDRVLRFTGPAHITVSTYSCGEEFLAKLVRLKDEGLIRTATLYCSQHGAQKASRLVGMMQLVYDSVHYINNHSKIMIIEGSTETVCVLASQNQTRGNRLENYTIVNDGWSQNVLFDALHSMPEFKLW